jgi:hypothetical protein
MMCWFDYLLQIIPSKGNRRQPKQHEWYLYRHQQLVENVFLWLKYWRGVATCYAKNAS